MSLASYHMSNVLIKNKISVSFKFNNRSVEHRAKSRFVCLLTFIIIKTIHLDVI